MYQGKLCLFIINNLYANILENSLHNNFFIVNILNVRNTNISKHKTNHRYCTYKASYITLTGQQGQRPARPARPARLSKASKASQQGQQGQRPAPSKASKAPTAPPTVYLSFYTWTTTEVFLQYVTTLMLNFKECSLSEHRLSPEQEIWDVFLFSVSVTLTHILICLMGLPLMMINNNLCILNQNVH